VSAIPSCGKKLIEVSLLLDAINVASVRDRLATFSRLWLGHIGYSRRAVSSVSKT
jgi:hypothetical protein